MFTDKLEQQAYAEAGKYGINEGKLNGPLDAYRHSYVSAVLTFRLNSSLTYIGGEANEIKGDYNNNQPPEQKAMDRHNNKIGRYIGLAAKSEEEISSKVYEALRNKTLISDLEDDRVKYYVATEARAENDSLLDSIGADISHLTDSIGDFFSDIDQGISDAFGLGESEPETPLRPQMLPSRSQQAEDFFRNFGGNLANGLLNESLDFVFDHVFGGSREHITRSETDRSRRAGSFPSRQQMHDALMHEHQQALRNH